MALKLYFDYLSQPSRALYILLKYSKAPFEACPVALRKGDCKILFVFLKINNQNL